MCLARARANTRRRTGGRQETRISSLHLPPQHHTSSSLSGESCDLSCDLSLTSYQGLTRERRPGTHYSRMHPINVTENCGDVQYNDCSLCTWSIQSCLVYNFTSLAHIQCMPTTVCAGPFLSRRRPGNEGNLSRDSHVISSSTHTVPWWRPGEVKRCGGFGTSVQDF